MSKLKLEIVKFPDRKCNCLVAYDENTNTSYSLAYFLNEQREELFLKALQDTLDEVAVKYE